MERRQGVMHGSLDQVGNAKVEAHSSRCQAASLRRGGHRDSWDFYNCALEGQEESTGQEEHEHDRKGWTARSMLHCSFIDVRGLVSTHIPKMQL